MAETEKNPSKDVQQFVENLNAWARTLPEKQQTLLRWLISRSVSKEIKLDGGKYEVIIDIERMDIEHAVKDALADLSPNPGLPTSGWVNGPWWSRWSSRMP